MRRGRVKSVIDAGSGEREHVLKRFSSLIWRQGVESKKARAGAKERVGRHVRVMCPVEL